MSRATHSTYAEGHHRHEDLGLDDCWQLLESKETGRIAFTDDSRIHVFPVNHVVRDRTLYFRTSAYGAIGSSLRDRQASFEVDEFDDFLEAGWSVLASGRAYPVEDPGLLAVLWSSDPPEPWAGGVRTLFICLEPDRVTGRNVHPG